jgi:hypothetical protein
VSYLAPQYLRRPNLSVLLHARVTRVVPVSLNTPKLSFRRVEFTQDNGGNISRYRVDVFMTVL